jgi:hypothetical protein
MFPNIPGSGIAPQFVAPLQGGDGQVLQQFERQFGGHGISGYPKLSEFDAESLVIS